MLKTLMSLTWEPNWCHPVFYLAPSRALLCHVIIIDTICSISIHDGRIDCSNVYQLKKIALRFPSFLKRVIHLSRLRFCDSQIFSNPLSLFHHWKQKRQISTNSDLQTKKKIRSWTRRENNVENLYCHLSLTLNKLEQKVNIWI